MGQTLSEPVVEKHSDNGGDDRLFFGVSSMQGWRISMEDAHAAILDLIPKLEGEAADKYEHLSYFGVYDGHGGDKVAIYTGEHLHEIIAKQEPIKSGDLEKAIKDGFLATDRAILSDPKYEEEVSGCTASIGIITDKKIYVGNAGDSRSVLGIKGRAKPMSYDHKPQNDQEKARICAAGGFVDFGRVNGNLALSRAIGDFEFKKSAELPPEAQIVTAMPDVEIHEITEDDEFLVVACDGIWDCQSSQAVTEFVRRGIVAKQELSRICENLMDNCLASNSDTGGVGCDNMTVIIIGLLQGKTKDEWYQMVADRVAKGDGPCAPPEYAEFRGPGNHHRYDDSPDDLDMDMDNQHFSGQGRTYSDMRRNGGGRVILLGDGSEPWQDASTDEDAEDDSEMFDHDDEDADLESQVNKHGSTTSVDSDNGADTKKRQSAREETPGPESNIEQKQAAQADEQLKSETKAQGLPHSETTSEAKDAIAEGKKPGGSASIDNAKLKPAVDGMIGDHVA